MKPKVTVIAWVTNQTFDQVRYLVESFNRQDYPNKELLVANLSDWHPIKWCPGRQFKLAWDTNPDTVMSELVRQAHGEYCVQWRLGLWYHTSTLSLQMRHTDPYEETRVNSPDGGVVSRGFYRRSYHLSTSGRSKIVDIGGIGLVKQIGAVESQGVKYFYHAGNLGDIIYGLPTVKALGGGVLYLGSEISLNTESPPPLREVMSRKLFETVAPLLRLQYYVRQTFFCNYMPKVDYDLNRFRLVEWKDQNLADMTMQGIGMSGKIFLDPTLPWLDVPEPVFGKPVVIHRSFRYHNPAFPWHKVLAKYQGQMEFVGFADEHDKFCRDFGVAVPFYKSGNLLDLARRIAGARLFVGNQSCPCAIAEAVKASIVQETDHKIANCKFVRDNVIYCDDDHLFLPDLETLPERKPEKKPWWKRLRKPKPVEKTFYHSGDIGDVIYSLQAVKDAGGGHVVLGPHMADIRPAVKPRASLTLAVYALLEPLVKAQSFVKSVSFAERTPPGVIDINHFRHVEWQRASGFKFKSIVDMSREAIGLPEEYDVNEPWLSVNDPIFAADVVMHRSVRFHGKSFPWEDAVKKYGGSAVFVGLKEEHRQFVQKFGWVPHLPTTDMLVLSKVIAGCQLFLGNQSAPYSIAEGLKKRTVQEMSSDSPNCVFTRASATYGIDKFVVLPDIEPLFTENDEAWNSELVSFFTTCKNRIEHLKQTLPQNIENHKDDPNVEFVLLDYSSDDGLGEWVKSEMMKHIQTGRLVYFRANGYPKFQMSHSKNCAARLTRGAVICNMDSDHQTGKSFAEWLRRAVKDGRWAGTETFTDDFGGRQAFRRSDFYRLGGFDEQMIGWGSDDYDISRRARILGLKCVEIPAVYKYSLPHSNELRGRFMENKDRDETNRINMERCQKNHEAGLFRVNPGRWGAILVEKNFEGKVTAV